jgi:2-amino-1-hydroxyethylphosphonate dioxygenase (glycine-forming)
MNKSSAQQTASQIISLYRAKGDANYSGEKITQLEHASQAAQLAMDDKNEDEVVIAAFLHDLGHLLDDEPETEYMDGYGVKDHEAIGADYLLQHGFSEKIAVLVKSHVEAKRYLCAVNQRYYEQLSHASKMTLEFQGGPMREDELDAFERNPLKNLIIKMRTWDEAAKHENVPLIDLNWMQQKLENHLLQTSNT